MKQESKSAIIGLVIALLAVVALALLGCKSPTAADISAACSRLPTEVKVEVPYKGTMYAVEIGICAYAVGNADATLDAPEMIWVPIAREDFVLATRRLR